MSSPPSSGVRGLDQRLGLLPRRRCRPRSRPRVPPSASIRAASSSRRSLRRAPSATAAPSATIASRGRLADPRRGPGDQRLASLERAGHRARVYAPAYGPGRRRLARGLGGDALGLADRGALERVRQRPDVGARRGLEDVGGDALAAGQAPVGAQHHGHLAERVLALGDRRDRVLAQLATRSRSPSRIAPKIASTGPSPPDSPTASSPSGIVTATLARRLAREPTPRPRTRRARSAPSRSRISSETIASRSSAVTCFFLSAISLNRLNAWLSALPSTLKPSCSSASRSAWRPGVLAEHDRVRLQADLASRP